MSKASDVSTRQICWLIVLAGLSLVAGRIAVVTSSTGDVPFFSANDRSRWSTVAALVDYRTYEIDRFQNIKDPKTKRRTWQSIDRVQHRGTDGTIHNYSSKPPLLATLVAGIYAIVKAITGMGIQQHTFAVVRIVLVLFNLPLFGILLACVTSLILRYSKTAFAAVTLTFAISFATLLTTFAISLNNHLPAATSVAVALWLLDTQSRRGPSGWSMFGCGIALAFAVANELPSLAFLAAGCLIAAWISVRCAVVGLVPGMLLVAIAFFGTNWWAHQSLRPPYGHRGVGEIISTVPIEGEQTSTLRDLAERHRGRIAQTCGVTAGEIEFSDSRDQGRLRIDSINETFAVVAGAESIQIRRWDDWYDYPGTYWSDQFRKGIDSGETSRLRYAFHVLVGHHGVFSLTPLWLLAVLGAIFWFKVPGEKGITYHRLAVGSIVLVTVVCLAFYLARPLIDRNYGGVSAGFRWLLWMAPLWIFLAIPAADWLAAKRRGRLLVVACVAASVFSVATAIDNPWAHPWIYQFIYE